MELTIRSEKILEDVHLGDSISVNGVCLTVTSFTKSLFAVDVMPETVKASTIRTLKVGSPVNLERAMSAGDGLVDISFQVISTVPEQS